MKIHFKVLRFFMLPTVLLILLRAAYFLSFKEALTIITNTDSGSWRIWLIIAEIVFYIFLYIYYSSIQKVKSENCYIDSVKSYVDEYLTHTNHREATVTLRKNGDIIIKPYTEYEDTF